MSHVFTFRISQPHLDTVSIPSITGRMLMLIILDDDPEIETILIPSHGGQGRVVIRTTPCTTVKLSECGVGDITYGRIALAGLAPITCLKARFNEINASPIRQITIDFDGFPVRIVSFVTGFNSVLCLCCGSKNQCNSTENNASDS